MQLTGPLYAAKRTIFTKEAETTWKLNCPFIDLKWPIILVRRAPSLTRMGRLLSSQVPLFTRWTCGPLKRPLKIPSRTIQQCQAPRFGLMDCPFGVTRGPIGWLGGGKGGAQPLRRGRVGKLFTLLLDATQVVIEALRRQHIDEKRKYYLGNFM